MTIFVEERCVYCEKIRKFVEDSPRHRKKICGDCWDWVKVPNEGLDLCGGRI